MIRDGYFLSKIAAKIIRDGYFLYKIAADILKLDIDYKVGLISFWLVSLVSGWSR